MRVLVTGATGSFGTPICRELAARGCEVFAMARREPADLPDNVRFVKADVQDRESVQAAVKGMDVVLHLAWLVASSRDAEQAEGINVTGTQNVLDAMRLHKVERFVFASSVMGYGSQAGHGGYTEDEPLRASAGFTYGHHKKLVEARIEASGVPSLVVRSGPVVGRGVRNAVVDQFAGPAVQGIAGDDTRWQFVHSDDVTRFLVDAVQSHRTGIVNLAAEGSLTLDRIGELLHKPVVRVPYTVAKLMVKGLWVSGIGDVDPAALDALRYLPVADTTRLREEFGFECAWSNEDAVADMRRALLGYLHFGKYDVTRSSYLPLPEPGWQPDMSPWSGRRLQPVGPAELRGEFDDEIDASMGDFTATNVAEAFPGPMTPLSLELSLLGLRASTEVTSRLLGLDGWLAHEAQNRCVASFANRIYLSVSFVREIYKRLPGSSPEEADAQFCGIPLPADYKRPQLSLAEVRAGIKLLRNGGIALARYGLSEKWLLDETERVQMPSAELAELAEPAIDARIGMLRDLFVDSQIVNVNAALVGGAALSAAERKSGGHGVTAGGLASSQTLEGVHRAAAIVRNDPAAAKALRDHKEANDALTRFAVDAPELHKSLHKLLDVVGHRGPGEFELSNPSFSDRPSMLFEAVDRAALRPPRPAPTQEEGGLVEKLAASSLQRRERIRNASIRIYHQLRLVLREKGRRMTAAAILDAPEDIFYLSYDQIFYPPNNVPELVSRRRAERERLSRIQLPGVIRGGWQPVATPTVLRTALSGNGVSKGVVRGRVRVLVDADDGLDPGEVLVCRVTDVGWTPLFASAAAVVSEIGGAMSHTAVVAREFGIPAVVGVEAATHHLSDGLLVEVDGSAGTVTVVEEAVSKLARQ